MNALMNTKVTNLDYKSKTYSNKEIRQNRILQNVGNYLEEGVIASGRRLRRLSSKKRQYLCNFAFTGGPIYEIVTTTLSFIKHWATRVGFYFFKILNTLEL